MLTLFARSLNGSILRALEKRPMSAGELLEELGGPSQTTLRGRLRELVEIGAVAKRGGGMPYSVQNELTSVGGDLLHVANAVAAWLGRSPHEPIQLGSAAARGAIKALADGWESKMLAAFAAHPLSLTQVSGVIASVSYPALERRLLALRATGLVEPVRKGPRAPYAMSRWGREAVGPIAAAAHFERTHMRERSSALTTGDVAELLLLAIPVAKLVSQADGTCALVAEEPGGGAPPSRISVSADRGRIVECAARLDADLRSRAVGDVAGWLHAIVHGDPSPLRISGDRRLPRSLVHGIHEQLFDPARHVS